VSYATYPDRTPATVVVNEILIERERQDAKWGEQNHADGTGGAVHRHLASQYRDECDTTHRAGEGTWRTILLEEVHEALAESDPAKLRAELIQVAAVAANWVECIDRRTS
jgi:hypothetical protein